MQRYDCILLFLNQRAILIKFPLQTIAVRDIFIKQSNPEILPEPF